MEPEDSSDDESKSKAPKEVIAYKSRGDKTYVDDESQDDSSDDSAKSAKGMRLPKTNINYLKAQEHQLLLQIEKNKQLIEVEK